FAARIVDSDSKIDNTRFSQPTRHHWRGASRDLLLLALSILIVKLTTLAFRNPRGTTGAALRVTFCCSHCRF
ncbi:MAG: hypothetical protein IKB11_01905, partial [Bacteroidaceae bacterium]|nr:hypothetical protein [Bacteroidaceae bacterium]